jgi:hypothetical protein
MDPQEGTTAGGVLTGERLTIPSLSREGQGVDEEKLLKMFEGMKLTMVIEVQGNVVQTNATHREGSRITVMDLDFGKLLGKPEQLAGMKALRMQSLDDAKQALKAIPGMRIDLNDELTVSFE